MSVTGHAGRIHVLPGDVISRIAAGEVVERPAAVVKELIENSLDAGCTRISVEVRNAGLALIRVVDDGEGMTRADAVLAFERHATSKLRSDADLLAIETRGFRGEALPSIASVSKVKLTTMFQGEPVGTRLVLTGGVAQPVEDVAAAPGTDVEVADLFFNTPARKKFLKTAATECSHISQVVQQASLASPAIQFRLRHNGQEVLEFPPVSSRRDRVLQVYHRRFLEQCLEVRGGGPGVSVEAYVIDPAQARAGRTPQELFVNSRPVKNATVSHAIYDAYGPFLAKGRHPLFVLFLDVDPTRVDVNVHPAKREVRFLNQDLIHQDVRRVIRDCLGGGPRSFHVDATAGHGTVAEREGPALRAIASAPLSSSPTQHSAHPLAALEPAGSAYSPGRHLKGASQEEAGIREDALRLSLEGRPDVIPLGQVGRTFLVAQVGNELQVVDQHTAHERVLFERLQRAWTRQTVESQPLLIPATLEFPAHTRVMLHQHLSDLEKLGLVVEPFGADAFVIRAVPAVLGHLDYGSLLEDLVDDLAQWNSVSSLEARVRPILATLACHSAVRAGRDMNLPEIKRLIEDWVGEGLPMTCPHGRRVALRLPMEELARIFGRT